jgi:phage repressor protein C with HTH and peptisase S24 domain
VATRLEKQIAEIEGICKKTGLSIEELADRAAISPETMRKISKGYSPASDMLMMSLKNIERLEMLARGVTKGAEPAGVLREYGGPYWGVGEESPIISWASAGQAKHFLDQGLSVERIRTPSKDPHTYVLAVEGESMEPKYSTGDLIVVTPSSEPVNGDLVVAKTRKDEVFFKLYHRSGREGDMIRLTSYHPSYPALEFTPRDFYFIHPVRFMIRKLRKD